MQGNRKKKMIGLNVLLSNDFSSPASLFPLTAVDLINEAKLDKEIKSRLAFAAQKIHTHMRYSNFNDIIQSIIDMDADVITIKNSRCDEKLLSVFREGVKYGAGIGPGVYDIHSPRIPSTEEIADRVNKMPALLAMVAAAKKIHTQLASAK